MLGPESWSLRHLIVLIGSMAPRAVQPLMSEVKRSAAEAFDTWGRENQEPQKHRWFQESATGWDQDVASLEFKGGEG